MCAGQAAGENLVVEHGLDALSERIGGLHSVMGYRQSREIALMGMASAFLRN